VGVGCGLQGNILAVQTEVKRGEKSPTGRCEAKVHAKRVPNAWNHWNGGGRPCGNHPHSRFQIPDPRRAGVSVGVVGEAWLGLLEACRLEIAEEYPWVLLEMRRYGTKICEMSEACRAGKRESGIIQIIRIGSL
jgi:hypothetical protein